MPGSTVTLKGPDGGTRNTKTDGAGFYSFTAVPPGKYAVHASAPHLAMPQPVTLELRPGAEACSLVRVKTETQKQRHHCGRAFVIATCNGLEQRVGLRRPSQTTLRLPRALLGLFDDGDDFVVSTLDSDGQRACGVAVGIKTVKTFF